jgi:hypothetical protein
MTGLGFTKKEAQAKPWNAELALRDGNILAPDLKTWAS